MSTADKLSLGLKNTFKKILSNAKVDHDIQQKEVIEDFKKKLDTSFFEGDNFANIIEAYKKWLTGNNYSKTEIERQLIQIQEIKNNKSLFQDGFKVKEEQKDIELKISFINPIAKKLFSLFDNGSGALGIKTTRVVFSLYKELGKKFNGVRIEL